MEHATARDWAVCQILKEMVSEESGRGDWAGYAAGYAAGRREEVARTPGLAVSSPSDGGDAIDFGAYYHRAKYRRDRGGAVAGDPAEPDPTTPLALAQSPYYLKCLCTGFRQESRCLHGFLGDAAPTPPYLLLTGRSALPRPGVSARWLAAG